MLFGRFLGGDALHALLGDEVSLFTVEAEAPVVTLRVVAVGRDRTRFAAVEGDDEVGHVVELSTMRGTR